MTDTEILDWLERRAAFIVHDRSAPYNLMHSVEVTYLTKKGNHKRVRAFTLREAVEMARKK